MFIDLKNTTVQNTTPGVVFGASSNSAGAPALYGAQAIAEMAAAGTTSTALSSNYTLTTADNGRVFHCTTALTVTIPGGLSPRPSVIIDCPPTGNLSIAVSSTATMNGGSTTTITRSRANNPGGVRIQAHQDADDYGVTGS